MRVGSRWKSVVDGTEVLVIRGPAKDVDLRCGGYPMVSGPVADKIDPNPAFAAGTLVGKRYVDEEMGVEVLCSKGGEGSLAIGDRPLTQREVKPLPTSD